MKKIAPDPPRTHQYLRRTLGNSQIFIPADTKLLH